MMNNSPDMRPVPAEDFIEAAELIDSHRLPVAWMLGLQIAVLGALSVWSTGFALPVQGAMLALLIGFLWYGNSYWLTSFCLVVFGCRILRITGRGIVFSTDIHLVECAVLLVTLIASFRYIELRSYIRAFGLGKSYRRLKSANKQSRWLSVVLGNFIRRQWYHSIIAMVGAFAILWRFPADNYYRQEFWMQPVAARLVFLLLGMFFVWFVCRAVISMWDWFLLTPRQADVAFRSWANREFWPDMAGVEKRRERLRLKDED